MNFNQSFQNFQNKSVKSPNNNRLKQQNEQLTQQIQELLQNNMDLKIQLGNLLKSSQAYKQSSQMKLQQQDQNLVQLQRKNEYQNLIIDDLTNKIKILQNELNAQMLSSQFINNNQAYQLDNQFLVNNQYQHFDYQLDNQFMENNQYQHFDYQNGFPQQTKIQHNQSDNDYLNQIQKQIDQLKIKDHNKQKMNKPKSPRYLSPINKSVNNFQNNSQRILTPRNNNSFSIL